MGYTYKLSSVTPEKINKLLFPIIFCVDKTKISKYIKAYDVISLNEVLSKRLLSYNHDKRYLYISDEISGMIQNKKSHILITDFEILFDPEYQLDVLKLFILLNRKQKVAVLWPGKCEQNRLKFAEPEYQDYKSYNINDYDITCII